MTWLFLKRTSIYIVLAILLLSLLWLPRFDAVKTQLGLTFIPSRAEALGLDTKKVFSEIVTEIHPDVIRIPLEWNRIEPARGEYTFDAIDDYIITARRNQVRIILVLGTVQSDSTSCTEPAWLKKLTPVERAVAQRNLNLITSSHFKTHQNLLAWQIGGVGGLCDQSDDNTIKQQIALVRARDQRPILITDMFAPNLSEDTKFLGGWYGYPVSRGFMPSLVTHLKLKQSGVFDGERVFVAEVQHLTSAQEIVPALSHARAIGAGVIIFDGVEEWFAARVGGDDSWITNIKQVFSLL